MTSTSLYDMYDITHYVYDITIWHVWHHYLTSPNDMNVMTISCMTLHCDMDWINILHNHHMICMTIPYDITIWHHYMTCLTSLYDMYDITIWYVWHHYMTCHCGIPHDMTEVLPTPFTVNIWASTITVRSSNSHTDSDPCVEDCA